MSNNGNVFDNSLFNFGPADDLFKADDNNGGGGLFDTSSDNNEEKPKEEAAAENTDLFGQPIQEETEEKKAPATPSKAAPVKAEEKKEEKATAAKTDAKKDTTSKPAKGGGKKDLSKVKVGPAWNIAYAARQMNPPEVDMTLEEVRAWLELDYPELSVERTKWDVDDKKMLAVPIVSGAKMG